MKFSQKSPSPLQNTISVSFPLHVDDRGWENDTERLNDRGRTGGTLESQHHGDMAQIPGFTGQNAPCMPVWEAVAPAAPRNAHSHAPSMSTEPGSHCCSDHGTAGPEAGTGRASAWAAEEDSSPQAPASQGTWAGQREQGSTCLRGAPSDYEHPALHHLTLKISNRLQIRISKISVVLNNWKFPKTKTKKIKQKTKVNQTVLISNFLKLLKYRQAVRTPSVTYS